MRSCKKREYERLEMVKEVKKSGENYYTRTTSAIPDEKHVIRQDGETVFRSKSAKRTKDFYDKL